MVRRALARGHSAPRNTLAGAGLPSDRGQWTGNGRWFDATQGFGFIQPDAGGEDVFVHASAVERTGLRDLREGQRVSSDIERDDRSGKAAAAILRVES